MDIIKKYKILLIVGAVILSFAFYWYEYRPSLIKKECYVTARDRAGIIDDGNAVATGRRDAYDDYYKWCLEQRGL